jgi:hypothetical protein
VCFTLAGAVILLKPVQIHAAGVTLITHGLNGDTDGWVTGMADAITSYSARTTNATVFKFQFHQNGNAWYLSSSRIGGDDPLNTPGGEVVVLFDWRQLADGVSYNTYQVAAALAPALTSTNFVPELGGHALAELPIHLVGHSRGGSLVCELSRILGTNGIWVDHVTTLDAHPLNNDGFALDWILYSAVDAPARVYENVLFADSYYQDADLFVHGEPATGAFWRKQTNLAGGYTGLSSDHSNIHLWYHGTIDWKTPTTDSEAWITSSERQAWWTSSEYHGAGAGFYYSLIGGGDRLSTVQPNDSYSTRIRDGFNQSWDLGAGLGNNRTQLPVNSGDWPNPIRLNLTSTNVVSLGDTSTLHIYYQWARPASSAQTVTLYLDDDLNPLNGNERLLRQGTASGTTTTPMGSGTISVQWNATNAPAGIHALFVKLSADGNSRYLYAPESISISVLPPPTVDIRSQLPGSVMIGIEGQTGQTMVLEQSTNLTAWLPVMTNTLAATRWETLQAADATDGSQKFFRAFRQ